MGIPVARGASVASRSQGPVASEIAPASHLFLSRGIERSMSRGAGRCAFLGIEGGFDTPGQFLRRTLAPELKEEKGRFLADHVVVQRNDVDTGLPQRPQHGLDLP